MLQHQLCFSKVVPSDMKLLAFLRQPIYISSFFLSFFLFSPPLFPLHFFVFAGVRYPDTQPPNNDVANLNGVRGGAASNTETSGYNEGDHGLCGDKGDRKAFMAGGLFVSEGAKRTCVRACTCVQLAVCVIRVCCGCVAGAIRV